MQEKAIKLVVASGKGGVGKSMLTSSLAMLLSKKRKIVAVDCDVDAPNLDIWLNQIGNWEKVKKISVSEKPVIDNKKCQDNECEGCIKKCKFNALYLKKGKLRINRFLCEGCGACEIFCPRGVVKMKPVENGEIREKITKYNFPLISGQLFPGETGSGKIVTELKEAAERFNYEIMLIDAAPGTGCPVTAALRDANFVVLVCEPTLSGFSDLKKELKVVNYFKISYGIVINKWDINPSLSEEIEKWAGSKPRKRTSSLRGKFLGRISYDKKIFQAVSNLTPILETDLKAKKEIKEIYKKLEDAIFGLNS